jgi:hypothetical protein
MALWAGFALYQLFYSATLKSRAYETKEEVVVI